MLTITVGELKKILNVDIHVDDSVRITAASTDTRTISAGNLFIPLSGDHFNGHDYISAAIEKGAILALCSESESNRVEFQSIKNKLIIVPDAEKAYYKIMSYWRKQFTNLIVIGIGGSTGKTTTKELLRHICQVDGETIFTEYNNNTARGMCIVTNKITESTKYLVCEMGTDSFGEITEEAEIIQPDFGVCLSVGQTHASLLGGTIDGVAKAESELVQYLSDKKFIVLNQDDNYVHEMKNLVTSARLITIGKENTDVYPINSTMDIDGTKLDLSSLKNIQVKTYGDGNIYNIMAAVTLAKEVGIPDKNILKGLKNYTPIKGRMNIISLDKFTIIDDAYNANPQSMEQSLDVFSQLAGDKFKFAFLGDMRELGEHANESHQQLIEFIKKTKLDTLYYAGDYRALMYEKLGQYIKTFKSFPNIDTDDFDKISNKEEVEKIAEDIIANIPDSAWVLFKGSKGTGAWKVLEVVKEKMGIV